MAKTKRIQRRRTRGWRMPPGTVITCRPSVFGNPWRVGVHGDAEYCVRKYEVWLRYGYGSVELQTRRARIIARLPELIGRDLACYCPVDAPHCHADVLLRLARETAEKIFPSEKASVAE